VSAIAFSDNRKYISWISGQGTCAELLEVVFAPLKFQNMTETRKKVNRWTLLQVYFLL